MRVSTADIRVAQLFDVGRCRLLACFIFVFHHFVFSLCPGQTCTASDCTSSDAFASNGTSLYSYRSVATRQPLWRPCTRHSFTSLLAAHHTVCFSFHPSFYSDAHLFCPEIDLCCFAVFWLNTVLFSCYFVFCFP